MSTLILGIGNTLLSDEGTGVHVVNHIKALSPELPDLRLMDGGTLSFTLAAEIAESDELIVVDAARFGAAPGSLRCFKDTEMDRHIATAKNSVHEVGLSDLLDIARLTDTLPKRRALVGIEPDNLDWGEEPSAPVAAAIPQAAEQVLQLAREWRGTEPS